MEGNKGTCVSCGATDVELDENGMCMDYATKGHVGTGDAGAGEDESV